MTMQRMQELDRYIHRLNSNQKELLLGWVVRSLMTGTAGDFWEAVESFRAHKIERIAADRKDTN